jgi:uncharacterized protein (DUF1330 family)
MPKGYWIAHVIVHDADAYENYRKANDPVFAEFGAKFLVRAGTQVVTEGEAKPRTVILEFPTIQAAHACYASAGYQAAQELRAGASDSDLVIVEGYE